MVSVLARIGIALWACVVTYITATLAYSWYVVVRAQAPLVEFGWAHIVVLILVLSLVVAVIWSVLSVIFNALLLRLSLTLLMSAIAQAVLGIFSVYGGVFSALTLLIMSLITFVIHRMVVLADDGLKVPALQGEEAS
ncbi:hypothetical protein RYZ27_06075 [Hyphomonas sp. FCG-A18]|uniref:hypothetical protein n=1 Tax=Hyphomonas sp. FCG-A18 TaxID=3080019 RepID=UPI002B30D5D1|nr:hypothetical protein RYZ27_06075 [Hyphomonas sp. FCG-A18]